MNKSAFFRNLLVPAVSMTVLVSQPVHASDSDAMEEGYCYRPKT